MLKSQRFSSSTPNQFITLKLSINKLKTQLLSVAALSMLFLSAPQAVLAADSSAQLLDANILKKVSIGNFEQINGSILRGGLPSDANLKLLAQAGVKTILDLRMEGGGAEHEEIVVKSLGMEYIHIPLGFTSPEHQDMVKAVKVLANSTDKPVFVHCRQGADRTGMVVGLYRRLAQSWDFNKTYSEMRKHHFKPFLISMKKVVEDCNSDQELNSAAHVAVKTSAAPKTADEALVDPGKSLDSTLPNSTQKPTSDDSPNLKTAG